MAASSSASSISSFSAPISPSPFRPTSISSSSFAHFHLKPLNTKLWSHSVSSSSSSSFNLSVKANIDDVSSQSALIDSMTDKIKKQLNTDNVVVKDAQGDGRHVSIEVVSSEFEGKSSMNRQRMVYKAIWEELQSVVHAVDSMRTLTPEEFAQGK